MKTSLLKYSTKKTAGKRPKFNTPVSFEQAKEIGLLINLTEEADTAEINNFVAYLKKQNKSVNVLVFAAQNHTNPFDFRFHAFTNKDINTWGQIKSEFVTEFIEKKYDYLITLNRAEILPFYYLMAKSKALCRVGCYFDDAINYYDIMVHSAATDNMRKVITSMTDIIKTIK